MAEENLLPVEPETDELLPRLKRWFRDDREHWRDWREQAREDYAFSALDQWTDEERQELNDQLRPCITFDRIGQVIESISGSEINNRQEVRYIPRELGDVKVNELYTAAGEWFRDECDAEDEESDSFLDAIICGMGWTETRIDYDEEPDGKPVIERIDPFEMFVDCKARKKNLVDSRRRWRVRDMPLEEAMGLFPDKDRSVLDAAWARDEDSRSEQPHNADPPFYDGEADVEKDPSECMVTIVQCQYKERETFYRAMNPETMAIEELSQEQYDMLAERIGEDGMRMLSPVKQSRWVYRQCFIGTEILEQTTVRGFTWACITGKRDRNNGTWFGIVRSMKDPQRWANKWLSQALHILNSNAKGGIIAETGAFEDPKQAEESYARPEAITWMKPGGATKIMPKPQAAAPQAFFQLMEFALSAVRDASGVNLEMLGQREATQAGVLEYQRRQSAMTILAPLFDSLRRYRKVQGRIMLGFIHNDLSDGRLIRILQEDQEQYVPLMKQPGVETYDIIVDQASASPNQKEATFGIIQGMLPVVGNMLTPDMWATVLEYSPLPSSFVEKLREQITSGSQQQAQMAQMQQQMQAMMGELEMALKRAEAFQKEASGQKTLAEARKTELETQIAASWPQPTQLQARVVL